jgi:hypothetical protein
MMGRNDRFAGEIERKGGQYSDVDDFSPQDRSNGRSRLVTPAGIKEGKMVNGKWTVTTLMRPNP